MRYRLADSGLAGLVMLQFACDVRIKVMRLRRVVRAQRCLVRAVPASKHNQIADTGGQTKARKQRAFDAQTRARETWPPFATMEFD